MLLVQERRSREQGVADPVRNRTPRSTLHTIELPNKSGNRDAEAIAIEIAENDDQRNLATVLLNRMYAWRGYGANHQISSAPHSVTFAASSGEEMIGTLTLTVDSPSGLGIDKTFRQEIDAFRSIPGTSVCELTKFAFDTSVSSKPMLAALFHVIFIYGSQRYNCTDLFIEVNPRHVRFYEAMLGFRRIGPLKTNTAVGAPAQLMWLKVSDIRQHIDEHADKSGETGRSLYPYFFSPQEEQAIHARLAQASTEDAWSPCPAAPARLEANYPIAAHHAGAVTRQPRATL